MAPLRSVLLLNLLALASAGHPAHAAQLASPPGIPAVTLGQPGGPAQLGSDGRLVDRRLSGNMFYAPFYGTCTWDAAHDVGPCIQLAEAAAIAAGGGTVELPGGVYGLATPLKSYTRGVHHRGMGVGDQRDNAVPSAYQSVTRLLWIGVAGATMYDEEPSSTESLYSADTTGIVFDCNSTAAVCAKFSQTSHSQIRIGVAEPVSIGAWLTTSTTNDSPGTQDNDISIDSRQTDCTLSGTGILLDGGAGSNWNVSYNRFWRLHPWYCNGDGLVLGNADNNMFMDMSAYPNPGATGTAIVFAAAGYTPPNGIPVTAVPYTNTVLHTGAAVSVQGYNAAMTVTPGAANTGTLAVAAITTTTTAAIPTGQNLIPISSVAGLAAGLSFRGSNPSSGLINDGAVAGLYGNAVIPSYPAIGTVASSAAVSFGPGATWQAVPGTYTVTFTSATMANITAPTGGHSQTSVTYASGVLAGQDLVLPLTGTPAAGDTLSVVVPTVPTGNIFGAVDKANSVPNPHFGSGTTGSYTASNNGTPQVAGQSQGLLLSFGAEACSGKPPGVGPQSVTIGDCQGAGATGSNSIVTGGLGNSAAGLGSVTLAGHNNAASGIYTAAGGENASAGGNAGMAFGETVSTSGSYSWARGAYSTDRGDRADAFAAGCSTVQGACQTRATVLGANLSSTAATALTVNAGAQGTNTSLSVPTNTVQVVTVDSVACTDTANRANWAVWTTQQGVLSRGTSSVAAYQGGAASALAPAYSGGSGSGGAGATLLISANSALNVLSVAVTWPNSDLVHCDAAVRELEIQ